MPKPHFAVIECESRKDAECHHFTFAPDGRSVVGFTMTGIARWNATSGKLLEVRRHKYSKDLHVALPSPDMKQWAVFGDKPRVLVLAGNTLKKLHSLPGGAQTLGWSSDGKLIVTVGGCYDELTCWDVVRERQVAKLKLKETQECDDIRFAGFANDRDEVLVGRNSGILTWDFRKRRVTPRVKFKSKEGWFWQHGISPDRSVMISLSDKGCLLQTDVRSWKTHRFAAVKNSHCINLVFSPDGKLAATPTGDGTVFIWDVVEQKPWLKWKKPNYGNPGWMEFSSDGQRLACTLDYRLFILDFSEVAKDVALSKPVLAIGTHQCVTMTGSDDRLDLRGIQEEPLNPLPVKCSTCRIADLDYAPETYLLGRGIDRPVDLAPAEAGNLLVRESARRIIEVVAPGQCRFIPTAHYKTAAATPWFLAVPVHVKTTAIPPTTRQRCPECSEPWCFHHYSECSDERQWASPAATLEIFKSKNWGCHIAPFKGWSHDRPKIFGRLLYFSVRMEKLLKKLGLRGLCRSIECKDQPNAEDDAWVAEKLHLLRIADCKRTAGNKADDSKNWFQEYLKKKAKQKPPVHDFAAVEKRHGVKLPESYKEFISAIGTKTFKDIDEEEGLWVHLLPPKKLEYERCSEEGGDEEDDFDGVMFASTDHGDGFCFVLSKRSSDYEVRKFDHESSTYEPYAKNFAECIKRFVGA
jgi:WD40 repeat protein